MAAANQSTGTKPPSLTRQYRHEYAIWVAMNQRCSNRRSQGYRYYGKRGIKVCKRWKGTGGFKHFLTDVGPQPFERASLNRKNNNGNYKPSNAAWSDPKTQARNMRSNHVIEYQGKSMTLVEWAEKLAMKPGTLGARLAKGWEVEKTLTQPVAKRRPFDPWASRR